MIVSNWLDLGPLEIGPLTAEGVVSEGTYMRYMDLLVPVGGSRAFNPGYEIEDNPDSFGRRKRYTLELKWTDGRTEKQYGKWFGIWTGTPDGK